MALSLHAASAPVFVRSLEALSAILDKAEAWATNRRVDPAVLAAARLIPDMFPLSRQVQTACDFAKNATARLAGQEPPRFEDTERTLAELQDRIARTVAFVRSVDPAAIDAGASREIVFPMGPNVRGRMQGDDYLIHYALPNFHFHLTTAYAILRGAGVEIGKRDYMGAVPGLTMA